MAEKILVVDDDRYIRLILQKKFLSHGYDVFVANDGESGLELAKKEAPDLIISDWMMPKMDGLEFCRLAKQDEKLRFTYFIILTARDTQDDKIEGIETGADDFVTKPFNDRELLTRVKAGLAHQRPPKGNCGASASESDHRAGDDARTRNQQPPRHHDARPASTPEKG